MVTPFFHAIIPPISVLYSWHSMYIRFIIANVTVSEGRDVMPWRETVYPSGVFLSIILKPILTEIIRVAELIELGIFIPLAFAILCSHKAGCVVHANTVHPGPRG